MARNPERELSGAGDIAAPFKWPVAEIDGGVSKKRAHPRAQMFGNGEMSRSVRKHKLLGLVESAAKQWVA